MASRKPKQHKEEVKALAPESQENGEAAEVTQPIVQPSSAQEPVVEEPKAEPPAPAVDESEESTDEILLRCMLEVDEHGFADLIEGMQGELKEPEALRQTLNALIEAGYIKAFWRGSREFFTLA
jgi:hypothetical protein